MSGKRFGPHYGKVFTAALLHEVAFMLLVHFPGYLDRLGVTESLIGLLYGVGAVLALAGRPALGRILDLTHRRTVLKVSGLLHAAVVLLLMTTTLWGPWLWVLFLSQRVLMLVFFTTMLTYAADSLPVEHRTEGLALFGLSGLLPIALGGVIGDLVIDAFGFHALFLLSASAGLASWGVIWRLPLLPLLSRLPRRNFWAAMVQRDLLPLWWVTLCFSFGLETLFTFLRTYVETRQVGSTGLFFGVYGVTAIVIRVAGGRHYDRTPHRPVVVGSLVAYGVGISFLAFAGAVPLFVAAAIAAGLAHGAIFPIMSSQVVVRAREAERGSAISIFTSLFDIALLLGVPAVGFLIEHMDYGTAFTVAGVALGVGAVVYALWDGRLVAAADAGPALAAGGEEAL